MLLAQITWFGLGLIFLFGLAMFKCSRGSCGRGPGFIGKTLGVVAVLAGVWMLVARNQDHRHVVTDDLEHQVEAWLEGPLFDKSFPLDAELNPLGEQFSPFHARTEIEFREDPGSVNSDIWLFGLLGAGLIILGVLLFGRDKQKPFVLKAVTWLGIGAIIVAVANFFGEAPHADRVSHRPVDVRVRQVEAERNARRPSRPGRAKRPSMRPDRPTSTIADREEEITLPPRAGSIPVELEIARAASERKKALDEAARKREEATQEAEEAKAVAAREVEVANQVAARELETAKLEVESANAEAEAEIAAVKNDLAKAAESEEEKPDIAVTETPPGQPVPSNRPAWINAAPALVDGVYRLTVGSGPWSSLPECQHALNEEILAAANNYINEYLGNPHAASLVNLSPIHLRDRICGQNQYSESFHSPSVGEMHQAYAQLSFDEQFRADVEQKWRHAIVQDRLWYIGGGGALVLALLATLYGYLKLELRTDTASRGKLQLAATLVALIVAAGALLARWTVVF